MGRSCYSNYTSTITDYCEDWVSQQRTGRTCYCSGDLCNWRAFYAVTDQQTSVNTGQTPATQPTAAPTPTRMPSHFSSVSQGAAASQSVLPSTCYACGSVNHSSPACEDPFNTAAATNVLEPCFAGTNVCIYFVGNQTVNGSTARGWESVTMRRCYSSTVTDGCVACFNYQCGDKTVCTGRACFCSTNNCNSRNALTEGRASVTTAILGHSTPPTPTNSGAADGGPARNYIVFWASAAAWLIFVLK